MVKGVVCVERKAAIFGMMLLLIKAKMQKIETQQDYGDLLALVNKIRKALAKAGVSYCEEKDGGIHDGYRLAFTEIKGTAGDEKVSIAFDFSLPQESRLWRHFKELTSLAAMEFRVLEELNEMADQHHHP